MSTIFLQIGSTDVSADVDIQTGALNSYEEYELWTDGNHIEHREWVRNRISGQLKVGFATAAKLAAFVSLLSSARTSGRYFSVTAYVINLDATPTFNAFLDPVGEAKWDTVNGRQWIVLTLSVRER